jgi:hypothetical protein
MIRPVGLGGHALTGAKMLFVPPKLSEKWRGAALEANNLKAQGIRPATTHIKHPQPAMDSVTNGGSAAIQRAALLARMIPSLARNQVPVSMADAALGGKSAPQHTVPMPQGAAVPPAAAPPAEDAVQDSGDAIDTFSSYIPTALPPCIVDILREKIAENNASSSSTADSLSKSEEKHEVIEILDTDNEDPCMEMEVSVKAPLSSTKSDDATKDMQSRSNRTDTETTSSLFTNTSIQSHTSPAVESALLSSVSAPPVPNEAAEVVLPLVREGKLSPLQAEGVCLAVNRFRRVFGRMGSGRYDGAVRAGENISRYFVCMRCVYMLCTIASTYASFK